MKTKIRLAVESTKNSPLIRIIVKITPEVDEEDATNTLYAFRDLASEFLVTVGDVMTGAELNEDEDEPDEEINEENQFVQLEFKNARMKVTENEEGFYWVFWEITKDFMGILSEIWVFGEKWEVLCFY